MRLAFTQRLDDMHVETLARHSSMKTSEDEYKAFKEWRLAQDTSAKRQKKTTPAMSCPGCAA